jgi:hypothetical protein
MESPHPVRPYRDRIDPKEVDSLERAGLAYRADAALRAGSPHRLF